MSEKQRIPTLRGLSEIAGRHDCLVSDVWGVLHNGRDAFFPAADALRQFRLTRGPVILLSNAPRLADGVEALFDRLGLPRDFYDGIVTSGSAARADLMRRTEGGQTLPVFYLGPPRDNPLLRGLNIRLAQPAEASVVLCTGLYDDETETPENYRPMLERFKAQRLPFLCANPDIVVQRGDKLIYCAGALARLYEELGGEVIYYGKPYPAVFEAALSEARATGSAAKPLVIGDNVETDIAGAYRMGLPALFISGGVHEAELNAGPGAVEHLFGKAPGTVCATMAMLAW